MSFDEVTLGDISIGKGGTYGIAASSVDFSPKLYTYLRITDINDDGTINKESLKSVNDPNASRYLLRPNDIVFARTGASTGRAYFYDGTDGEFVFAGFLIKFSLDDKRVNPKYIKYYTKSDDYKNWISSFNTGSTRGNINAQTYSNMKIFLPPRGQQDFLVDTLSCLDEKIEMNNYINKKLEEMAQAIFKSWFVDFEPFKDGEFVESELGMIPKGWKIGTLGEVCEYNSDTYTDKDAFAFINYLDTGNITDNKIDAVCKLLIGIDPIPSRAKRKVHKNDIVYSTVRPNQRHFGIIREPTPNMLASTGFMVLRSVLPYLGNELVYLWLTRNEVTEYLHGIAEMNASTYPSIRPDVAMSIKILLPDEATMQMVSIVLSSIYGYIWDNNKQSQMLVAIRNTLLPKLMSGEIRVPTEEVV